MTEYSAYSRSEVANILIIEKYKQNIVNNSVLVARLTTELTNQYGARLDAMLMMAQVNILIENNEFETYE